MAIKRQDISIKTEVIMEMFEETQKIVSKFDENKDEILKALRWLRDPENAGGEFVTANAAVLDKVIKIFENLSVRHLNLSTWFDSYASKYQELSDSMSRKAVDASDNMQKAKQKI